MPLTSNVSLIFKAVPKGLPVPGEHLVVEDRPVDLENVPENGLVLRNMYNSLDPYMRLMLVESHTKHYRKPYTLNEPLHSLAIAEVIQSSSHQDFAKGTLLRTSLPIQEYSFLTSSQIASKLETSSSAKLKLLPSPCQSTQTSTSGPSACPA